MDGITRQEIEGSYDIRDQYTLQSKEVLSIVKKDINVCCVLGWISRRCDVDIWTGLDWPPDRERWRMLVSAVMNLRVP